VAFFGPLSTYYNQAVSNWLKSNLGRTVSVYQVGRLFAEAYEKAARMKNAVSGFKSTGIYPLNPNIFPEWMFAPAEVTDIDVPEELPENQPGPSNTSSKHVSNASEAYQPLPSLQERFEKTPSPKLNKKSETKSASRDNEEHIPLKKIVVIPKILQLDNKKKRKSQGPVVLNSTPNLDEIKEKAEEKKKIEERRSQRRVKAKFDLTEELSEPQDPFGEQDDEDEAVCIYCNELYSMSKPREIWILCQVCKKWCHTECAGVSPKTKIFTCELCG